MSERIDTYGVWQDDDGQWRWAHLVDGDEYDRGIADTEEEAMEEALASGRNERDVGIYETWSDTEQAMLAIVDQGEAVTVKLIERADGSDVYELTAA